MVSGAVAKHKPGAVAADCGSAQRNRYFRGKQMRAEEFDIEQRYFIGRRRLVNRAVLGWGVAYGLAVSGPPAGRECREQESPPAERTEPHDTASYEASPREASSQGGPPRGTSSQDGDDRPGPRGSRHREHAPAATSPEGRPAPVKIGRGFALDRHGREIVVTEPVTLGADNVFLRGAGTDICRVRSIAGLSAGSYLLSLHYAEHRFGDANLTEGCGCARPEKKFVCETSLFSLTPLCEGECPCAEESCNRDCDCSDESCCGEAGRGPHACLCQWVRDADIPDDPEPLCEWQGYWISPRDGVALACVTVIESGDKCDPLVISCIDDDCGPRRLVKSNDLLYDLLRGCDLTRISWISWADWHRSREPVSWHHFAANFHPDGAGDGVTDFVIRFSGPVLADTIRLDTVVMTASIVEQPTGWLFTRRVPIVRIDVTPDTTTPGGQELPPNTTNQMRLIVRPRWLRDELDKDEESWLSQREFTIEIEIRGDLILDCHRQAIDGEAIGLDPTPSGNGSPGGTFISSFRVHPKPVPDRTDAG
jgi:hypothetical protein